MTKTHITALHNRHIQARTGVYDIKRHLKRHHLVYEVIATKLSCTFWRQTAQIITSFGTFRNFELTGKETSAKHELKFCTQNPRRYLCKVAKSVVES